MSEQNQPLILVVDDYQDAREMYAEYLQFSGFRVAEAKNGNEAVEQAFALMRSVWEPNEVWAAFIAERIGR